MLLGAVVLLYLGRIAAGGAGGQTAADMAALAAARSLASDPSTAPARVRASADAAARDNGARLVSLRIERTGAVADGGRRHDGRRRRRHPAGGGAAASARPRAGEGGHRLFGAAPGAVVSPGRSARRARPAGGRRGRGGADRMAVRLGRREPCGGRVRLLGAHRLRVRRSRPRAPRPPDRGRPVAPRRAGDARCAGAGRPGVRRRRLRSAPPRRHVRRRRHGRGGSTHGRGRSLRAARRRRLGRLRAARRAAPAGTPIDPAVERAARTHQVPAHVIAAELELGVVADAGSAATALAAAQRRHPGDLQAALADALGDGSLAAAVLRQGSGPGLEGAGGTVRLLPVGDQPTTPLPASRMHVAPLPPSPDPGGGGAR